MIFIIEKRSKKFIVEIIVDSMSIDFEVLIKV